MSTSTDKAAKKAAASNTKATENSDPSEQPTDAEVEAANEPGGQPGAVLPRPDLVDGLSSAKATPLSGAPGGPDEVRAASGPLSAPEDRESQTYPAAGYDLSSTDATYAAAGGRTVAGERFDALVGENGEAVSADALFDDTDGKSYVTASQRVYEQFYYPNTTEQAKRLLYVPGQKVARAEAERMKATLG